MRETKPKSRSRWTDTTDTGCKSNSHAETAHRTNKHVNSHSGNASNANDIHYQKSIHATETTHSGCDAANSVARSRGVDLSANPDVICDGMNLTAHLVEEDQAKFKRCLLAYKGELKIKNAGKMKPYRNGRVIYDGEQVVGQIRFDPFDDRPGYFFLHVNPDKLNAGQCKLIQHLVSYILGEQWCSFVSRARVSMFDAAVNVRGVNISSIIPVPSRAVQSGFFLKFSQKGRTRLYKQGTEYMGHNQSEKHACVYDKADEQSEVIDVTGAKDVTRIEVQAKPRVRSKFGEEITALADLPRYANPFRMLSISEFPKEAAQNDFLRLATSLTAYVGATEVLQLVGDKDQRESLKKHLSTSTCSWWQPDKHWSAFLLGLAQHPLFACCDLLAEPAYSKVLASAMNSMPDQL